MNGGHKHETTIKYELICHTSYAIFSVLFALTILSIFSAISLGDDQGHLVKKGARLLFHSFHFMHIVFAVTGTIITFSRFSKSLVQTLLIGTISPAFFCMLSDSILPYLGGKLLHIPMHLHICFIDDFLKVIPFLLAGIVNGLVISRYHTHVLDSYAITSHATHIFISSLASTFYLVSHGFTEWYSYIGIVFLFLIVAVVVPCTIADIVVPTLYGKKLGKSE